MLAPFVYLDPGALTGAGIDDERPLAPDDDHHLRTVLRLRPGAELVLSDGEGTWCQGRLTAGAVAVATPPETEPAPRPTIEVVHGLPKGRKLDEVVRVLTELGVDRITPVHADRSPVELRGAKADKVAARWRAVARSAGAQARRVRLPVVDAPGTLEQTWSRVQGTEVLALIAHPDVDVGLGSVVRGRTDWPERVVALIGPESGWSDAEVESGVRAQARTVHLGRTVLRTEHAAAAVCAALALVLGRMD